MIGWVWGGAWEVWTTVGPYDAGYRTRYTVWVRRRVCVHVGIVGRMEGGGFDLVLVSFIVGRQTWRFLVEYWEFRGSASRCMHVMMW